MSRPKFLADHDLNEHIVSGVLRREPLIEFLRVRDIGLNREPDAIVLEFAHEHQLLVVSHDVNTMPATAFERIAAAKSISGFFMVQQSMPVGSVIDELVLIWLVTELEDWENQVVFLPLA